MKVSLINTCRFVFLPALGALIVFAGCNGDGNGENDTVEEQDAPPDIQEDDVQIDTPVDPGEDEVLTDPAEEDPQADEVEEDTPEEEAGGYPECEGVGGACTDARWELCPPGTEPLGTDPRSDCPGWCCVDAPPSTCSDDSSYNCVIGTRCEDISGDDWGACWGTPDGAYECEDGRVCCMDVCG